jgi:hypothetical protein
MVWSWISLIIYARFILPAIQARPLKVSDWKHIIQLLVVASIEASMAAAIQAFTILAYTPLMIYVGDIPPVGGPELQVALSVIVPFLSLAFAIYYAVYVRKK